MTLPTYLKNNQSGQVLVIFLLVLVIGLALVLSIASRTVTDIRQTTTSDESNRAYFAAESGIEDTLKKLQTDSAYAGGTLDFTTVNRTTAEVSVSDLKADPGEILDFLEYKKDDVAQINLMSDFNDVGTAGVNPSITTGDVLILHYASLGTIPNTNQAPALEVSFITKSGGVWDIRKMTFDPNSSRSNGFCKVLPGVATDKYQFSLRIDLDAPTCSPNNEAVNAPPVLARVKFLYNSSPFGVEVESKALPKQGEKIVSVGETPSGVSRKLEVKRFYPTLPAIFDYVLYNGSSGDLCKGSCN